MSIFSVMSIKENMVMEIMFCYRKKMNERKLIPYIETFIHLKETKTKKARGKAKNLIVGILKTSKADGIILGKDLYI